MVVKTETTDYGLLEMMGDKDDPFSKEAFKEFNRRHKHFIFGSCFNFFSNWPSDDAKAMAKDLRQETLMKVLKSANGFKQKKGLGDKEITNHVRGWIYRIIKNAFNDEYVKKPGRRVEIIAIDPEQRSAAEFKLYDNSRKNVNRTLSDAMQAQYRLIQKAMLEIKITEKQRDILKIYLESGEFDERGNWNLPESRMKELMEKHGIMKNSIIQSKNRLIQRIKDQLQKTNP